MKTIFVLILFLFNLFTLSADSRINIPINEVLLYRDRTQITRVGNLEFKPGENKFILDSLPTLLSDDSLRAYSENPVLSITSIITFVEPGTEYKDKKFSSLKKQLDELESKRKQIERKKSNLINEKNVLEEYRKLTGESISKKAAYMSSEEDLKKWKETLNYFQSRSIELGKEIQKSDFELEDLDKLVNELNLKLDKIISSSGKSKRTVEIRVTNSTSKTIKSVFSISYLIGNFFWSPAYNII
ncbi:MAG: DUF4140 domain-containing protein [Leptospiraceae bacterium]|nr:DUF4140 domain-containing protein [Leptospiraceae bacterium]